MNINNRGKVRRFSRLMDDVCGISGCVCLEEHENEAGGCRKSRKWHVVQGNVAYFMVLGLKV